MNRHRSLIVVADDFGIGPATSRGILELAQEGCITASALLVNSPYAQDSICMWRRTQCPMELGWHANLTLDCPVLPAAQVSSLVDAHGRFWSLRNFMLRCWTGRLRREEIRAELHAQWQRFIELVGSPPPLVNAHHHVALFEPVGSALLQLLHRQSPRPYLRRVQEHSWCLIKRPEACLKRLALSLLGRRLAARSAQAGFPGCDCLAGVHSSSRPFGDEFFVSHLACTRGRRVELMCHPGYYDETLLGRDEGAGPAQATRREEELRLLRSDAFLSACRDLGFELDSPVRASPFPSASSVNFDRDISLRSFVG